MKKYFLLIFIFSAQLCLAQNPLVKKWDHRYGGNLIEWLGACIETEDNGFLIGGMSNSDSSGNIRRHPCDFTNNTFDHWVVKSDSLGNLLWERRFGGYGEDELTALVETGNAYYLAGTSWSNTGCTKAAPAIGSSDYWIIKTDLSGNKIWEKTYGGYFGNELSCAITTNDGSILLGGNSTSDSGGTKTENCRVMSDYWFFKIDTAGNVLWDRTLGGAEEDVLKEILETEDGGFLLAGYSFSDSGADKTEPNHDPTLDSPDYWIVKTDSDGNRQWDKRYGGNYRDFLSHVSQTPDHEFLLTGNSYSGISGDKTQDDWDPSYNTADVWVVKIRDDGTKIWDRRYGGTLDELAEGDIQVISDGGYLFSGLSYSDSSGDKSEDLFWGQECWIVKIDSGGQKIWDRSIHVSGSMDLGSNLVTNDGCYLFPMAVSAGIGAEKTEPGWGADDYWLIKYCDTTFTTGSIHDLNQTNAFVITPNPTTGKLKIQTEKLIETIQVFNLFGENVLEASASNEIDLTDQPPGIYFIRIQAEGKIQSFKIVLQ